jgi:hypothetical protein
MNKLVKALFLIAIISILLCCNIEFAYEDSAQNGIMWAINRTYL